MLLSSNNKYTLKRLKRQGGMDRNFDVVVVGAGFEPVPELFEDRLERDLACSPDLRLRPGTTA